MELENRPLATVIVIIQARNINGELNHRKT